MSLEGKIKQILEDRFEPKSLDVINESHRHKGHSGDDGTGQTHFKIIIRANVLESLSRVERHRAIMSELSSQLGELPHSISIDANS